MTIFFRERMVGSCPYVIEQLNGVNIGSRLTDNRLEPDDYRFPRCLPPCLCGHPRLVTNTAGAAKAQA